jgi:hypothetical protein
VCERERETESERESGVTLAQISVSWDIKGKDSTAHHRKDRIEQDRLDNTGQGRAGGDML